MKNTYFIIAVLLLLGGHSWAQTYGLKYYTNCLANKNYFAHKGDTVIFNCDSIRLLNPTAYNTLQSAYMNLYKTSNQLVLKTDSAGVVNKLLFEQKTKEYDALYLQFANFRTNTQNHILATDTNIMAIRNYTNQAKLQLNQADSAITAGINQIKDHEKNKRWMQIKYTSIGFLIGILSTITLVLIK